MTIGERAEDVFYISDEAGNPLDTDARERLRDNLVAKLGD
jgi:UTP:GlnB (protein PII) uridylyltransferase